MSFSESCSDESALSTHSLRYVMKNRATGAPLFVAVFKLLPVEGLNKDEAEPAEKEEAKAEDANDDLD